MMKKRILVVDDEENVTKMLKLSLEKAGGYEVKTENMGANVIAAARQFRPNLILLDIMMPDMDGGEIAGRIKSDTILKDTPVVFLTAAITKEEIESQSSVIGGQPFIAKPTSVEEIIDYIEKYAR